MAKVVTDNKHYQDIADAIRTTAALSPDIAQYKPSEMADGVRQAGEWQYGMGWGDGYNAGAADTGGYDEGFSDGYNDGFYVGEQSGLAEGIEQGKQAEYDRMWDMIQQNGNRTAYEYAFMDWGWEYIRPKYKIAPTEGYPLYTFTYNVNLKRVEAAYVDFSKVPQMSDQNTNQMRGFNRTFSGCNKLEYVEDVGLLDRCYIMTFRKCYDLHTIEVIRPSSATVFSDAFTECNSLVNLTIDGTIGQNGLNLQWSTKLSKASIESVVNALSVSASGKSVTLSKTAVNTAFTTEEWATLAATKSNWTINLV